MHSPMISPASIGVDGSIVPESSEPPVARRLGSVA